MVLIASLLVPLLTLSLASKLLRRQILTPKTYALALLASVALTWLLAAGTVVQFSVLDILLGHIGNFSSAALVLYAVLLASNLLIALSLTVCVGGDSASGRAYLQFGSFFLRS